MAEYENSIDLDKRAHIEPPDLDLHSLPSNFGIFNMI